MQTSKILGASIFNHRLFLIVVGWLIALSVTVIIGLGIYALSAFQSPIQYPNADELDTNLLKHAYGQYLTYVNTSFRFMSSVIGIMLAAVIILLILLALQMYAWHKDRERLVIWRDSGFLCERLEILPGNCLRLNNLEIQLNRAQLDTLCQLVQKRLGDMPLHALDIGEHGVQSIKRLREELGSKFLEKAFIKVKKGEGYWLEVDPVSIRGFNSAEDS